MKKYRYITTLLVAVTLFNISQSSAATSRATTLMELNAQQFGFNIECPEDDLYKEAKKVVADIELNFPSYTTEISSLKSELIAMNANCEIANNTSLYVQNLKKFLVNATNVVLRIQADEKAKNKDLANAKIYKNCTELNKQYSSGVAKTGYKNKGLKIKKNPLENDSLYQANIKLDKDKDGIACEK